ncbi:hypothetical protein M8J77_006405, partial [Diaphorina citri]
MSAQDKLNEHHENQRDIKIIPSVDKELPTAKKQKDSNPKLRL